MIRHILLAVLYASLSSALSPSSPLFITRRNIAPKALTRISCEDSDSRDAAVKKHHNPHTLLLDRLEEDLKTLNELRPPQPSADPSFPVGIVSAGSSYTRIWTHQIWKAHSDPPHWRYFRHVRKWHRSTTARKILPTVLLATCWSVVVSLLAKHLQRRPFQSAIATAGTASAVSLLSAPLALLLTLRANASMARLLEARQSWGKLVLQTRGLSSILGTYLYPTSPEAAVLSVRYLSVLGWILKAQLRGEDEAIQQQVLELMLKNPDDEDSDSEYRWMMSQQKRSVAITSRIRQICGMVISSSSSTSPSIAASSTQLIVEERIRELESAVGACERLFGSPIPPTYTRHLSRVMSLWLLLLPVSLVAAGQLKTLGVAFVATIAAYVFVGLDEVGMEIENVFQLLPLQQLAAAIHTDVQDQFLMIRSPPAVPDV